MPQLPPHHNPGTLGWSRSVCPSVPSHASIRPQVRGSWKVTAKGRGDGDGDGKGVRRGASHTKGTKPDGKGLRGPHPRGHGTGPEPSRGGRGTGVAVPLLRGRAGRHGCAALGPRQPRAASGGVGHGAHGAREQRGVGGVGRNNGGSCGRGAKEKKKKKESSGKIPVLGPWQRCPDPPRPMDYCTKKCYFCFNNLLRRWNSNAGFVLSSEGALFLRRPRSGRGLRGRPHLPLPEVSPRPGRVSPPPHVPQPRRRRSPRALPAAPGGPHPRSPPRSRSPGRGVGGGRAVLTPRGERGWGRTERRGASGRRSAPGDALTRILPIETGTGTSSPSRRPSVGDGDRAIRCRGVSSRGSGMAEPGAAGGHGGRELRFAVPGRGGTVGAAPWEGAGPPRRSGSRRRGAVNGRKAAAGPPGPGATSPSRVNGRFPSWRRPGPARPLRAPVRARGGGGEGENAPGRG